MGEFHQIVPEGTVYPYVFACGEPRVGRSPGRIDVTVARAARAWCLLQFGYTRHGEGTSRWRVTSTRAKFLDKTHAAAFKLRWC